MRFALSLRRGDNKWLIILTKYQSNLIDYGFPQFKRLVHYYASLLHGASYYHILYPRNLYNFRLMYSYIF